MQSAKRVTNGNFVNAAGEDRLPAEPAPDTPQQRQPEPAASDAHGVPDDNEGDAWLLEEAGYGYGV